MVGDLHVVRGEMASIVPSLAERRLHAKLIKAEVIRIHIRIRICGSVLIAVCMGARGGAGAAGEGVGQV